MLADAEPIDRTADPIAMAPDSPDPAEGARRTVALGRHMIVGMSSLAGHQSIAFHAASMSALAQAMSHVTSAMTLMLRIADAADVDKAAAAARAAPESSVSENCAPTAPAVNGRRQKRNG